MSSKRSPGRWLVAVLVGIGVFVVGTDLLIRQLSFDSFRPILAGALSRVLRADVEIAGTIHLGLVPSLQLELEELTVAHSSGHRFEIGGARLDLEVLPLLGRLI